MMHSTQKKYLDLVLRVEACRRQCSFGEGRRGATAARLLHAVKVKCLVSVPLKFLVGVGKTAAEPCSSGSNVEDADPELGEGGVDWPQDLL